jgi:hypothetical protein
MFKEFIVFQFFWRSDKKNHGIIKKVPKNTNSTICRRISSNFNQQKFIFWRKHVRVLEATYEGIIKKSRCNKCTNLYFLYLGSFHFEF